MNKPISYDKIITQDMIMPYVTDMNIERAHEELFDKTFNLMQEYVIEKNIEPNQIFQTVNLLKFSWVHNAFEDKLRHEDENARKKLR